MKTASIYTYSVLYSSTEDFKDKTPYLTAILQDAEGNRFASLVEGFSDGMEIAIGQEVYCTGRNADEKDVYSLRA